MSSSNEKIINSELLYLSNLYQESEGEVKLWRAVIIKALEDLKLPESNKKYRIWKKQAKILFNKDNEEFLMVCQYAQVSPDHVVSLAKRFTK